MCGCVCASVHCGIIDCQFKLYFSAVVEKPVEGTLPSTDETTNDVSTTKSTSPDYDFDNAFGPLTPVFTLSPEKLVYIVQEEGTQLSCAALEATVLAFFCNDVKVPKERVINAFKVSKNDMLHAQHNYKVKIH